MGGRGKGVWMLRSREEGEKKEREEELKWRRRRRKRRGEGGRRGEEGGDEGVVWLWNAHRMRTDSCRVERSAGECWMSITGLHVH